jgi:hypothetical protein
MQTSTEDTLSLQVSPVYISRKIVQAVVNSTAFSWLNSLAMKITASKID